MGMYKMPLFINYLLFFIGVAMAFSGGVHLLVFLMQFPELYYLTTYRKYIIIALNILFIAFGAALAAYIEFILRGVG
jgi:hypothetical protein